MSGTEAKKITLRADHVAGAAFVAFGGAIIALSGDLPVGALSMPGAGFLPRIVATLTIVFGLALILRASAESPPFAELDWADGKHALMVTAITAAGILFYERLGFIVTMLLTLMALLTIVERRNPLRAAIFCAAIVTITYAAFVYGLKTPLPEFGF
jgi:uncharacterized MnhB-related membrane protein